MAKIHSAAVVDPAAELAEDAEVGPFCIVGPGVKVGAGTRLLVRVQVRGRVSLGRGNVLHPNTVIGGDPQDLKPAAADGRIEIGDENLFRESVTINFPKMPGGVTRIGSRNRFHVDSHVGHDSLIGDGILLGSFAVLGGHSVVEDGAWIEGQGGTHQFVTVGRDSWCRTHIPITEDVPPFMWVDGNHFEVMGVNPRLRTPALEGAFETLWRSGLPRPEALARLDAVADPQVRQLVAFLRRSMAGRMNRAREAERG